MNNISPTPDKVRQRQQRRLGVAVLAFVLIVIILLTILIGRPLLHAMQENKGFAFREWMRERGFMKYPLMVGIIALQVVIAFIPGEPIEFAAGYIFGAALGSVLCVIGFTLGCLVVVLAVRKFGMKLLGLIFSDRDIENVHLFRNPTTRDLTIFLLFLIPGTPKDVLTYLGGLMPIHLGRFLLITGVARMPSLLTSTLAGSWAEQDRLALTLIIYGVTLALTIVGALVYRAWQKRSREAMQQEGREDDVQAG